MTKKIYIGIAACFLIILFGIQHHIETTKTIKLIGSEESVYQLDINGQDLTSGNAFDGIVDALKNYDSVYKPYGYRRDGMTRVWYEIIVVSEGSTKYIVLGDDNYWYTNSNKMYTIIDGNELLDKIRTLMPR